MTRCRALVTLVVVVVALGVWTDAAGSDPVSAVGWWTSSNPGVASPIPTLVPTGSPSNLPSDIPPGGFEVANAGPDQSYAAVAYDAYGGATVQRLVLKLAADTVSSTATVVACPLDGDGSFAAVSGAPLASGPKYSCDSSVTGVRDASAGSVAFDVGGLVHGTRLAVALVMKDTGRLVFAAPDASAVVVAAPAATVPLVPTTPPRVPSAVVPRPIVSRAPGAPAPVPSAVAVAPASAAPPSATVAAHPHQVLVTLPDGAVSFGGVTVGVVFLLAAAIAIRVSNRRALFSRQ